MTDYRSPTTDYKVLIKRGEFLDGIRNRAIPYKIYYPADYSGTPLPVILWSHGYGGNRDGAGFISRHVAGQGYVIVHLTHAGSDSSLWEGKPGHPWDVLRKNPITREMTLERFQDVPFVLDTLPRWAEENPEIGALMDLSVLGMSGHSFGAMTTQAMAGELFPDEHGKLRSFADKRFAAGILYSAVPIRTLTHENPEPHIYGAIDLPLFHMTGTKDDSPLEGFGYERRLAVYDYSGVQAGGTDKYLMVLQEGDHMIYNGTRGQLAGNPHRERHEELIKAGSLAFWDAYLKNEAGAKDWLTGGGMAAAMAGMGDYRFSLK